ncbi:MAG: stage V sporulation protein S [Clostridia bacterium]|nr:stage V sporulation protein S [Clostridia bacterium]
MDVLKISTKSNPNSVAGAIAGLIKERGKAEMQVIGAGAINQAIKAIAIARGFVAPSGVDLICIPAFTEVKISDDERTGIRLLVEPR